MRIQNMFQDDINRKINGVIKVNQDDLDVIMQEVREYVITRELKKHFMTFFNYYCEMFDNPNADIGVWLSGFFGSGKSHLLKMLSYILENKEIDGTTVVEMFREKFENGDDRDPATFMLIDRATRVKAETILFNIDIEGSINKDKTAVLRVFAKMFYNHLGFYGENLKVAQMEYYIEQCGKTAEFRRVFEEKRGMSWEQARKAFSFNGKYIVPTLMEVLDMTEKDADAWFRDKSAVEMSIALLADEIREYVEKKPKDFRLLFMIDEVGQYVGTDTDMLINLQSLVEEIGRTCGAKVWVMCTGQEALDEIIKVRQSEFSRIQARFKVHLSLTSSSADEVIQRRLLKKTSIATQLLEGIYTQSDSILRNLFTFKDAMLDIKGYSGPQEFAINFPFVPYQFLLIQKIFSEIRKHGNAGKHYSGAERSMLDGFQIAVKKIQSGDEYNLAPLFSFYDSIHEFLDGSIRRVIERCANAAATGAGIEPLDVDVLKLLYLIRYVPQDMPANLDNIVILMADNINVDPISMRKTVAESLNRLFSQNYIGRTGDTYNFLTDEEQDIWKEIFAVIDDRMLTLGQETLNELSPSQDISSRLLIKDALHDVVFFHLPEEPNGYLSNWYPSEFTIDGNTFSSTEQYIMYRKCKIFGDDDSAAAVLETNDPAKQQAIGQGASGFDGTVWNGMKQVVAYRGLLAKFSQNENLKQQLLDTGDAYLVECAHKDIIWACGARLTEEERFDISKWRGQNILGFALMEVRNALKPKASALFEEKPVFWGLRGDQFFWEYLKEVFSNYLLPMSEEMLEQIITSEFEHVSGCKLTEESNPCVERFAHGGMSSGLLCGKYWIRNAIPLLKKRCREILK